MGSSKNIVVFTDFYPYASVTEQVFVEPDIAALSTVFDKVYIVPLASSGSLKDTSRWPNVIVDSTLAQSNFQHSRLLKSCFFLNPYVLFQAVKDIAATRSLRDLAASCSFNLNTVSISFQIEKLLKKHGLSPRNTLLYTFWFYNTTAAIGRLQGWSIVSRAHGYEVYESGHSGVFISPVVRRRLLERVKAVYTVSYAARDYLRQRYRGYADKIHVRMLGTERLYEVNNLDVVKDLQETVVLSVARVVPLKRVMLNLEVMKAVATANPDKHFRWIHVGDGSGFKELKEAVASSAISNLAIELRGSVPNDEVHRVYRDEKVSLFLLLSTNEGLPVSICEAMSYGVPVVATDVGGNSEIVNSRNGILVDVDSSPESIAKDLTGLLREPKTLNLMREIARKTWEDRFDVKILRTDFAMELKSLIGNNAEALNRFCMKERFSNL